MPAVAVALAHGVVVGEQVLVAHGQSQREDAVASADGLQRVAVCAAHGELVSTPAVGSFALADGGRGIVPMGRIDEESPAMGAVAAVGGLVVDGLRARRRETAAVPCVRQFVRTDGHGVGDGIDRIEMDGNTIDIITICLGVHHSVGIDAVSCDAEVVPEVGLACAEAGDCGLVDGSGWVDNQRERMNAVASGCSGQGVIIDTCSGEGAPAPSVGFVAADRGSGLI